MAYKKSLQIVQALEYKLSFLATKRDKKQWELLPRGSQKQSASFLGCSFHCLENPVSDFWCVGFLDFKAKGDIYTREKLHSIIFSTYVVLGLY